VAVEPSQTARPSKERGRQFAITSTAARAAAVPDATGPRPARWDRARYAGTVDHRDTGKRAELSAPAGVVSRHAHSDISDTNPPVWATPTTLSKVVKGRR